MALLNVFCGALALMLATATINAKIIPDTEKWLADARDAINSSLYDVEAYGIGDSLGALGQVHDIAKESFNKFVDFTKMGTFGMIDMLNSTTKEVVSMKPLLNKWAGFLQNIIPYTSENYAEPVSRKFFNALEILPKPVVGFEQNYYSAASPKSQQIIKELNNFIYLYVQKLVECAKYVRVRANILINKVQGIGRNEE